MATKQRNIPVGFCQCGCGERTNSNGGNPKRYLVGHGRRLHFWEHVRRGRKDECWDWQGSVLFNGYGRYRRRWYTHRYAYEETHGEIPAGKHILHKCDRPICVNPQHLYAGTPADNARDMVSRRRHRMGSQKAMAKLTEADVPEIRRRLAAGETQKAIAADYGIHRVTLGKLARGLIWKHV